MQFGLRPQRIVLHVCEPLGDELSRENVLFETVLRNRGRARGHGSVGDIDLVAVLQKPRCPSSPAVGLVEEVL